MYGLIVKLVVVPGQREHMIGTTEGARGSYVVAKNSADEKSYLDYGGVGQYRQSQN